MKKFLSALLAAAMMVSLVACGNSGSTSTPPAASNPPASTSAPSTPAEPSKPTTYDYDLRMTTGSSGSVLYMFGSQFIDLFKDLYPGSTAEVAVGGGVSNISTVSMGDFNVGSTAVPALFAAMNGVDPFTEKMDNIRAVFRTDPIWGVAMVTKASGIESLQQVKDNKMPVRLAIMPVGKMA